MDKPHFGRPLADLTKNAEHYNGIFQLYLDFSLPVKITVFSDRYAAWSIQAIGVGLDGEDQIMSINDRYGALRMWKADSRSIPVQMGKIYYKLQSLGYDVGFSGREQARRYENYAINGTSNLLPRENREVLLDKLQRQETRRKELADAEQ